MGKIIEQAKSENLAAKFENATCFSVIEIMAENCKRTERGTWEIEITTRPLSKDENTVLQRLFPNTLEQAWRLLHRETLLSSIVEE